MATYVDMQALNFIILIFHFVAPVFIPFLYILLLTLCPILHSIPYNFYYYYNSLICPVSVPFLLPPWVPDTKKLHLLSTCIDLDGIRYRVGVAFDQSTGELGLHLIPCLHPVISHMINHMINNIIRILLYFS